MLNRPFSKGRRLGAAIVLTAAMSGGLAIAAAPAGASVWHPILPPTCTSIHTHTVGSAQITGIDEEICTPPLVITKFPVSISKLENGKFVVVASGEGVVTYTCNGSTENEFAVLGVDFDAACG
jgi:hypothetical protein